MPVAESASTALRFRGIPNGVACIANLDLAANRNQKPSSHLSLALPNAEIPSSALRILPVSEGISRLWFKLPPYTPPGTYHGNVRIQETDYSISVDVEANENLVLSQSQLRVIARAGEQITAHFTLANAGNVTCDIGKGHGFGLFDVEGAERAVGAAFSQPEASGREKMDRLMDRLKEEHAGFVRVHIEEGAGSIRAGEMHELTVRFRFPDNMKPGRGYTGTWVFFNIALQVRVMAPAEHSKEIK
jgi:hypothetical protein